VRVGVAGALGRLGRVACTALAAADEVTLVAAFARSGAGEMLSAHVGVGGDARVYDELEAFYAVGMDAARGRQRRLARDRRDRLDG
jgi:dihydrodipicolinate reductase